MRRLNPRDSQLTILTDVNIHRIIRRSSTFGPRWQRELTAQDDKGERGIFFIFISARWWCAWKTPWPKPTCSKG